MADVVYKYQTSAVTIGHILGKATLRFTPPGDLNDPFECGPDPGDAFINAVRDKTRTLAEALMGRGFDPNLATELLTDKVLRGSFQKAFGKFVGVLSLSRNPCDELMWSHYADNHAGVVIGFDSTHNFFQPGNGISRDGLKNVAYQAKRPNVPLQPLGPAYDATLLDNRELTDSLFFTKSPIWSHESEVRVLGLIDDVPTTSLPGVVKFPSDMVLEIIIGARTKADDIDKIYSIAEVSYPRAKVLVAVLDAQNYGMRIEPALPRQAMILIRS
ncbi:MAG: DUF2971 domain-containing protein [Armatimonadetes bacterium]|nr:DUF2971 domain-containing protein [Armatimonadota bacterium]